MRRFPSDNPLRSSPSASASPETTVLLEGCIFDVKFSTRRGGTFQALGLPSFGRNVGQCGMNPCDHVHCGHGGTCVDSGSSV